MINETTNYRNLSIIEINLYVSPKRVTKRKWRQSKTHSHLRHKYGFKGDLFNDTCVMD